jgi:2-alkyl-3-oxoalkanoate reductase
MKLLVTGSSGFLGKYVVAEALRRGHAVRAMVRPVGNAPWAPQPKLEIVRADLRSPRGLAEAVAGVDAVLHLAAAKSGDFYAQFRGTVNATENLCDAMRQAGVRRLVAIGTFSVYDYLNAPTGSTITETSRIEPCPEKRDDYARTKLLQEQLVRDFAEKDGGQITVLRPGVIFGRDNAWNARLGAQAGSRWIRIGANARLPLVYVENCAEAIVIAAEKDEAIGKTVNLVDDDMPAQRDFMAELAQRTTPRPTIVPVNWTLMRLLAGSIDVFNRTFLGGRAKVPSIFVPARLHARCKPLRYDNSAMKNILGYQPRYALAQALDRTFGAEDPLKNSIHPCA